ncbi:hypothetical protein JCM12298_28030 [Desulfothermus naphthae]
MWIKPNGYISKLITEGECYFLSRPRRFGKSLTISTLKELFYGNKELFKAFIFMISGILKNILCLFLILMR